MMQISFLKKSGEVSTKVKKRSPYMINILKEESFFIGSGFNEGIEKLLKQKNFSEAKKPEELKNLFEGGDFKALGEEELEEFLEEVEGSEKEGLEEFLEEIEGSEKNDLGDSNNINISAEENDGMLSGLILYESKKFVGWTIVFSLSDKASQVDFRGNNLYA